MMTKILNLKGVIRNVKYESHVRSRRLKRYEFATFNINSASSYGIIEFDEDTLLGYSKWVSPKRTRSYPFARIYNTYHLPKKITIIPIIKDEGLQGDNDRINFITLSWMNLMNIYVVLAWYDNAISHRSRENKITAQKFDNEYIKEKIIEIKQNQKSALHWNMMHFDRDFEHIYRQAVQRYQEIGQALNSEMHPAELHMNVLEQYLSNGLFSRDAFTQLSLLASLSAAQRETVTIHELEFLGDGDKAYFELENLLGGQYHLTADEVYWEQDILVIQESKNSSNDKLPKLADIQDGLSKGILFRNIDELYLDGEQIQFTTRLKLTGKVEGTLNLPTTDEQQIQSFATINHLTNSKSRLIEMLNQEAQTNSRLNIQITGNQ